MTGETRAALAEAREHLAAIQARRGGSDEATIALLARAVGRLADAIEAGIERRGPQNARVIDEDTPPGGRPFDRSRPSRGYNRDS